MQRGIYNSPHNTMPNNVFPYPGNKARHSEWIISHLPEHELYAELFGGAAGILFNKPGSRIEVYNDTNRDLVHFFEVLREKGDELREWLENVPYSRSVYNQWADGYYDGERSNDDVERAGRFYYLRYASFGGKIENKSGFATGKHPGGPTTGQYHGSLAGLDYFRERIQGVIIESLDWSDVVERYDREGAVFYADPPYEGTEGRYNSEGFNHRELARVAKEIEGKILISYDSLPHFYGDGFTVTTKDASFAIDSSSEHKDATEYLIMNFDSDGQPLMSGVGQQGLDAFAD